MGSSGVCSALNAHINKGEISKKQVSHKKVLKKQETDEEKNGMLFNTNGNILRI